MMPSGRYVLACHIASIGLVFQTPAFLGVFKGRVQIAAYLLIIEATSFAASIPAVSLSNMITTRSKLSTNSKFLATAFAPVAPVPTETKRLPCACDIERQSLRLP